MSPTDTEVSLLLDAVHTVGDAVEASEGRIMSRMTHIATGMDSHAERIAVIETKLDAPAFNWKRVLAYGGIGGAGISTPWLVELIQKVAG